MLLVDDDEFVIDLYAEALQKAGFTVFSASNPQVGLSKMAFEKPNVVLLDVAMPEMSGLQFLEKARDNSNTRNIPIAFLSNIRDDATIKQGLEKGAAGYLLKTSLTPSQVVEEVERILGQRHSLDEAKDKIA